MNLFRLLIGFGALVTCGGVAFATDKGVYPPIETPSALLHDHAVVILPDGNNEHIWVRFRQLRNNIDNHTDVSEYATVTLTSDGRMDLSFADMEGNRAECRWDPPRCRDCTDGEEDIRQDLERQFLVDVFRGETPQGYMFVYFYSSDGNCTRWSLRTGATDYDSTALPGALRSYPYP